MVRIFITVGTLFLLIIITDYYTCLAVFLTWLFGIATCFFFFLVIFSYMFVKFPSDVYLIYFITDGCFFIFYWNHRSCAKHVFCSRDWIVVSQNSVSEEQEATMVRRSKGNTEILFQKWPIPTYRANNVGLLTSEQLWQILNSSVWSRVSRWKWKPAHFVL